MYNGDGVFSHGDIRGGKTGDDTADYKLVLSNISVNHHSF